jgi:eukaryotic-like serine/threonine-protein kinase
MQLSGIGVLRGRSLRSGQRSMATMVKAGRYEIIGELGRGAMGVVYRAIDPVIGRNVAVKTIRLSEEGTGLTRPELLSRFQTEARAAGLLTHPNIVVVYDAGEENGLYYITMELVEGKSVQALLDGGHEFPVPRLLRIMEQTCSALQFAHERNIVHRDIKPANLMLTADDTVKVTDFGTAKILQFGTAQQTTHVMGTPSYMSPEQVKGRPVDGRSDIFSLGVMFYEMLTGEKPFPGQSVTTVIYKIVNEDPIPPRQLNSSIHPGLNDIVMRALAKEPEVRYQNCREMQEDLRNYRSMGAGGNNPDATMVSPRPNGGGLIGPAGGGLRGLHGEDPTSSPTLRSLQSRTSSPTQTPIIRRTGPVQTYEEPVKKSPVGTILAAVLLLAVIAFGGYKLRPELEAVRERNKSESVAPAPAPAPAPASTQSPSPAQAVSQTLTQTADPTAQPLVKENVPPTSPNLQDQSEDSAPKNTVPLPSVVTPANQPKPEATAASSPGKPVDKNDPDTTGLTPAAADYKSRIVAAISQRALASRVKITGIGNTLTISGKLRPAEHSSLLHFMRNAPAAVHVVDDIQYDDTPVRGADGTDNGAHPVPTKGNAAIHVITDVVGATATLIGNSGKPLTECQAPCSFNNLVPAHYSLQVQKDGYQPLQTAVELKSGESQDQRLHLESLARGLFLSTRPAGADVFINGVKQSGQTPVTLPLAAGQFNMVLRLNGYEAYAGQVQVKENIQTTMDVPLKPRAEPHVAWAQVTTTPRGAEIFVDGNPTGQLSPARVQVSAGAHNIVMRLAGYQPSKRAVEVSEGGTVTITESLNARN